MVSVCLENLEDLSKKGVDKDVIGNTGSVFYIGVLSFIIVRSPPDQYPAGMSDTVRTVAASAGRRL